MPVIRQKRILLIPKRLEKNIKQIELADKTGIRQSRFSKIENGYENPSDEEKRLIAKHLKCKIIDIFPEI